MLHRNLRTFAPLFEWLVFPWLVLAPSSFAAQIGIASVSVAQPAAPQPSGADNRGPAVPKYEKLELLATLTNVAATQFFEPDPTLNGLDLTATFTDPNNNNTWNIKGFYDGTDWRVRFAPNIEGAWTYSLTVVDSSGTAAWTGGRFFCTASAHPGFARIGNRYLQFTEGQVIFPVGHNNGYQTDLEQPSLASMAAQGENLLSFWISTPWILGTDPTPRAPIENAAQGIGVYNQPACAYIDGVIAGAESAGVYVLPSIWSHDSLCDSNIGPPGWPSSWANNAYKSVCQAADFYQISNGPLDTPQWHYQKNLYRYMLARWGYSRALVGWVAVVEAEGTTGNYINASQVAPWCAAVRDYFARNDPFRVNGANQYPLAASKSDDSNFNPGLDLRACDSYANSSNDTAVANTIAVETMVMRGNGQPAFHAEFGGDIQIGASQPAHLHNGIWAGTASGAALCPLLWCDGQHFPLLTNPTTGAAMRNQLQILSQFVDKVDYFGNAALAPATLSFTNTSSCIGWGMNLSDRGFAWVQNTGGTMGGQTLTISGLAAGTYSVTWYDVWNDGPAVVLSTTGTCIDNQPSANTMSLLIPSLARADIAIKFILNSTPPAPVITSSASASGAAGTAFSYRISATNSPVSYSAGTLPGWLALDTLTGVLSGTPVASGTVNLTLGAMNAGGTGTKSFAITIQPGPAASLLVSRYPSPVNTGTANAFTVAAHDNFGNVATGYSGTVTFASTDVQAQIPANYTFTGADNGIHTFTLTFNTSGTRALTATDTATSALTGTQSGILVNSPLLTMTPITLSNATVGVDYNQTLALSGGVAPYTFTVIAGSLPQGIALVTGGTLSGIPTAGGTYSFAISGTDSSTTPGPYSTALNYSITVAAPTLAILPAALPQPQVGAAYNQPFTGAGGTSPYFFSVTAGTLPSGMSFSPSAVLSGTPTAGGTFTFSVSMADSSTGTGPYIATRNYSLSISAPAISFSPLVLPPSQAGIAYLQAITASGGTAPYSNYAVTAGALPPGVLLSSRGVLSGSATVGGAFAFTVSAIDSSTGTGPFAGSQNYVLTVSTLPLLFTPAMPPAAQVGVPYAQQFAASGGVAPYANVVLIAGTLPPGLSLSASGLLSGIPSAGGVFTFTLGATDSSAIAGPLSGQNLTLPVNAPSMVLVPATLSSAHVGESYNQAFTLSGGTSPYTFAIGTGALPAGLSLSAGGVLSGVPSASGTFAFTLIATDSSGGSGPFSTSQNYFMIVDESGIVIAPPPPPPPPAPTAPQFTSSLQVQPNPAIAGEPVTVQALSTGTTTIDFGDGTVLVASDAIHTYASPGNYTVIATATSAGGAITESATIFVSTDLNSAASGNLIGVGGATRKLGALGVWTVNHLKPLRSTFSGRIAQIGFESPISQLSLTAQSGVLLLGSGNLAQSYAFKLDKNGNGKTVGISSFKVSIKSKSIQFSVQGPAALTSLAESLGATALGSKRILLPATLSIGDQFFLAVTFVLEAGKSRGGIDVFQIAK